MEKIVVDAHTIVYKESPHGNAEVDSGRSDGGVRVPDSEPVREQPEPGRRATGSPRKRSK